MMVDGNLAATNSVAIAQSINQSVTKPNIEQPKAEPVEPLKPLETPINPGSIKKPEPINEDVPDIYVKNFEFIDNTVFSSKRLGKIVSSYKNKYLTFTERQSILKKLTELYQNRGYDTSYAAILIQDNLSITSETGILKIRIVEGRIGTKTIIGTKRLKKYVSLRTDKENSVFNINRLTQQLIRLQVDPLIKEISIKFSIGNETNILNENITVVPSKNYLVSLSQNNYGSESTGTLQTEASISLLNPTTLGDKIRINNIYSAGGNRFNVKYEVPFASDNSSISVSYTTIANTNIIYPFNQINLKDSFQDYQVELSHPLKNLTTTKYHIDYGLKIALDYLTDQGSIFNFDFPTQRGSDNSGTTKLTFIRYTQYLQFEDRDQALSLESVFNQGVGLDSHSGPGFSHTPFYWSGDFLYQRKITSSIAFITKGGLQLSAEPLPSIAQFGLGGKYTILGYQLNESSTDNAIYSDSELKFLIYSSKLHKVYFTPFIAGGYGWNTSIGNPNPIYLGTGTMFDYSLTDKVNATLGIAIPLIDQVTQSVQGTKLFFNIKLSF